ncbi:MAG: hypothetical protein A4E61_01856 [Syntrophorhabdus sp. PtaB.Bin184]|jgi:hypothetical protein|nr:MAG: hypothetical protein A4E61_01856 [Syntrophorhabdus sp. PtaB.Bin184]
MVKVAITIDTEEDLWSEYVPAPCPVENIDSIPLAQDIFDRYDAIPTYLVDYPVVIDAHASRLLQGILEKGRCELGTHCHPWNTPPYGGDASERATMLCNLEDGVVRSKMENLHKAFVARFGVTPVSFRAGRWGFGPAVARSIQDLGYRVDSSVIPLVDWSVYGGPDFFDAPRHPYRLSPVSILVPTEDGDLLEAPPTTGFFQSNAEFCRKVFRYIMKSDLATRLKGIGLLERSRIINLRWLSPEFSSGEDMLLLAERLVRQGTLFLNMYFHSTSLLPGKSPFVRDEKDLQRFLLKIRMFLQHARDAGWKFIALQDTRKDY